jgi:hypothetical protein
MKECLVVVPSVLSLALAWLTSPASASRAAVSTPQKALSNGPAVARTAFPTDSAGLALDVLLGALPRDRCRRMKEFTP